MHMLGHLSGGRYQRILGKTRDLDQMREFFIAQGGLLPLLLVYDGGPKGLQEQSS